MIKDLDEHDLLVSAISDILEELKFDLAILT
jgi:hypothetical protein